MPYFNAQAVNTVWVWLAYHGRELKIKRSERLVLICLAVHISKKTDTSWPSIQLISTETGLTERAVYTATKRLKKDMLITWKKRGANRNEYTLKILPKIPDTVQSRVEEKSKVRPEAISGHP